LATCADARAHPPAVDAAACCRWFVDEFHVTEAAGGSSPHVSSRPPQGLALQLNQSRVHNIIHRSRVHSIIHRPASVQPPLSWQ
jgi:hypothetical protein